MCSLSVLLAAVSVYPIRAECLWCQATKVSVNSGNCIPQQWLDKNFLAICPHHILLFTCKGTFAWMFISSREHVNMAKGGEKGYYSSWVHWSQNTKWWCLNNIIHFSTPTTYSVLVGKMRHQCHCASIQSWKKKIWFQEQGGKVAPTSNQILAGFGSWLCLYWNSPLPVLVRCILFFTSPLGRWISENVNKSHWDPYLYWFHGYYCFCCLSNRVNSFSSNQI